MKVYVAHTGRAFDVKVSSLTDRVGALKEALVQKSDIPTHDQILLCADGLGLDSRWTLQQVPALRSDDAVVFLFNRQHLMAPPTPSAPIDPNAYDVKLPAPQKSAENHPLGSAPSLMIRALPDFEKHFEHHLETGRAYARTCEQRFAVCMKLLRDEKTQLRALEAVMRNLSGHCKHMNKAFGELHASWTNQHTAQSALTSSFEADLESLGHVDLHPKLRAPPKRLTLLDCFEEKTIRTCYHACVQQFDGISAKVRDLGASNAVVTRRVPENPTFSSADIETIENDLKKWDKLKAQHDTDLAVLDHDCRKVKTVIEEVVKQLQSKTAASGAAGATAATDNMQALEKYHAQHREEILRRFESDEKWLKGVMIAVVESHVKLNSMFFKKLAEVRDTQEHIETAKSKVALYAAQIVRHQQTLDQLIAVKQLPGVYKACLSEITRRRSYRRSYLAVTKELTDKLNALRTAEVKQREQFHSAYQLPKGFLTALLERPTFCDVKLKDLDGALPEIDDPTATAGVDGSLTFATSATSAGTSAGGMPSAAGLVAASTATVTIAASASVAAPPIDLEKGLVLDRLTDENKALKAEIEILKAAARSSSGAASMNAAPGSAIGVDRSGSASNISPSLIVAAAAPTPVAAAAAPSATLDAALATIDKLNAEVAELKRTNDAAAERSKRDAQRESELVQASARANEASVAAEAAAAALREQHSRASEQLEALRTRSASERASAEHQSSAANATVASLRSEIDVLKALDASLRAEVAAAEKRLSDANSAADAAKASLSAASKSSADAELKEKQYAEAMENCSRMLRDKNAAVAKEKKTATELNAQISNLKQRVEEVLKNNVHVELELKKYQDQDALNKSAANAANAVTNALKKELALLSDANGKLKADHEQCATIHSNLLTKNKALTSDKEAAAKAVASEITALKQENAAWKLELSMKLTYRSFHEQDTALFVRNEHGFHEALHRNAPHHYLALEQKSKYDHFGDRILARIFLIEKAVASNRDRENPYRLAIGTVFYRLYVSEDSFVSLDKDNKENATAKDAKDKDNKPNKSAGGSGGSGGSSAMPASGVVVGINPAAPASAEPPTSK